MSIRTHRDSVYNELAHRVVALLSTGDPPSPNLGKSIVKEVLTLLVGNVMLLGRCNLPKGWGSWNLLTTQPTVRRHPITGDLVEVKSKQKITWALEEIKHA